MKKKWDFVKKEFTKILLINLVFSLFGLEAFSRIYYYQKFKINP